MTLQCIDILYLIRTCLIKNGRSHPDSFADAAGRFQLVEFGYSPNDVDQANNQFWSMVESGQKWDEDAWVNRLRLAALRSDQLRDSLIITLVMILALQPFDITKEQFQYVQDLADVLDMKPSEYRQAMQRGDELAAAVQFIIDESKKA